MSNSNVEHAPKSCIKYEGKADEDDDQEGHEARPTTTTKASKTETSEIFKELTRNCIKDIYEILEKHQDVSYRNALEINKEMQNKLLSVRTQLQRLHNKVVRRYKENQATLMKHMEKVPQKTGRFGKTLKGRTFFIRGNTFFKDENMRSCPNNDDYTARSKKGELFPMDFELVARHIWSITDKMSIVRGIKEQIITEKSLEVRISNKNVQLTSLLEEVGPNFEIDWTQIASHNLKYRHTATSCKAMWNVYLHPSLNHDAFDEPENERLLQAAQKFTNWATIAKEVGKRSDYQCFIQYHTTLYTRNRGWQRWDKRDDQRLLDAIEAAKSNGVINWTQVAFKFPQKSKASLQQRYQYAINPAVSHAPFTPEEDLLLLAAVEEYGENFARLPRTIFPNRSIVQLRSRYKNTLQNRHKSQPWTLKDDEFLMEFVKENGASSWKKLEEAFDNRHTRIACRQRYTIIQKHLSMDANATLATIVRRGPRSLRSDVTAKNWHEKVEQLGKNPNAIEEEAEAKRQSRKRKKKAPSAKKVENGSEIKKPRMALPAKEPENGSENKSKKIKKPRMVKKKEIYEEVTEMSLEIEMERILNTDDNVRVNEMESILNTDENVRVNESKNVINNLDEPNISTPVELPTTATKSISTKTVINNLEEPSVSTPVELPTTANKSKSNKTNKNQQNKSINNNKKSHYIPKSQNPIYVQRLRANDLKLHNFLKYAYKFRFGQNMGAPSPTNMEELEKARDCFGFQMPENQASTIKRQNKKKPNQNVMPEERNEIVKAFLKNSIKPGTTLEPSTSYRLPPNFSSLTLFRALCVASSDYKKIAEKDNTEETENSAAAPASTTVPTSTPAPTVTVTPAPINERGLEAINRFRQRLHNLLCKSAALSRLPPSTFPQNSFIHRFNNQNPNELHISEIDDSVNTTTSASNVSKSLDSLQVKTEFIEENESVAAPNIKTEIVFEAYQEIN